MNAWIAWAQDIVYRYSGELAIIALVFIVLWGIYVISKRRK